MAITTYAQLQAAIADHMARSDLTDFIPDFITMGENWLNYGSENALPLRCREMEAVTSLTPVSGVCALPTDYLEYRRVVEVTGVRRNLTYMTADMAEILYPSRSAGLGERFTIIGSSLYTFPLAQNDIELTYYQALPPLASNPSGNWLLAKAPGLYLRATLIHAYDFVSDNVEMEKQAALAKALVAGMNKSDMMGKYARAGLTLRGITP